ncbi:hypothetical protein PIB30_010948 [Stylosanthes scabra]|uniref:C2 NT-type domain-containing protein n=1 Tax=Stylosanthes scabra TaxID=79078 RepID=A0ABU6U4G1_9FABA|nr:hypothetical protein [Stylosanthes scabra]
MAAPADSSSSNAFLEELEALSDSLYKSHTTRRTASLVLPRTSSPSLPSDKVDVEVNAKPRSRRMSLSPWRSRTKLEEDGKAAAEIRKQVDEWSGEKKKGIWRWKPMRALSHIGMQKVSCLFSVEVVAAQGLPSSMNGLRLAVCVRKQETKDGAVKTMPSRVAQGAADFEETLFIRCHVYTTTTQSASASGKQVKFEPRPFSIYLFAADAKELDFGRSSVDLSELIQESIQKNHQGTRVRQWDTTFSLSGKAKGGELVLKLGFQIMEKDGGLDIYNQLQNPNSNSNSKSSSSSSKLKNFSSSFARKQSKTSFSMPSPRMASKNDAWTPSHPARPGDIQGMDDLNLDDPNPKPEKVDDFELPDFEVVDKGVEVQDGGESEKPLLVKSTPPSEVVKEIVHDHLHLTRLSELDSIAQQIKALESMMGEDDKYMTLEDETQPERLDADEETVTREFLQLLEDQDLKAYSFNQPEIPPLQLEARKDSSSADGESNVYLPDLGKGLGCVVQTRDGGYLASMNPLDIAVERKDTPKLAMQMSKPFVLESHQNVTGFELFQKLAGVGLDELTSQILSLMPIDELRGKTAEQVAFEGIASAIIHDPVSAEKLLALAMQRIESMAVEALKIQAEMAEEEAPFEVSALSSKKGDTESGKELLASPASLEDWIKDNASSESEAEKATLILVVQLRDPLRRYEAVGGPMIVVVHATHEGKEEEEEEKKFKLSSMHVGGFKVRSSTKKNAWDNERQRLTAMQWLVSYGFGKAAKKGKQALPKGQDLLWTISSRIVADMWLKTMRNPDIKLLK